MTWFLVPVLCVGPSGTGVSEAFYELDDDIAVVSVTPGDVDSAAARETVELALAIDDQDAGAAAAGLSDEVCVVVVMRPRCLAAVAA